MTTETQDREELSGNGNPAEVTAVTDNGAAQPDNTATSHTATTPGPTSERAAPQEDSALFTLVTKLCKQIACLEEEIKEIKKSQCNNSEKEKSVKEREGSQRKVVISGKEKVFKSHKVLNGLDVVDMVLQKCDNDDAKKNKVFKGWIEVHKILDRFMSDMATVTGSPLDTISGQ